jgi:membrane protease YdiL (CAAX protease family)
VRVWVEIRANLLAWLILTLASALPVFGLWLLRRPDQRWFAPQRTRFVPWSGFEVCFVFLFTQVLLPAFLNELLSKTGFFNWLYGPGFGVAPAAAEDDLTNIRRHLWVAALAFPFQLPGTMLILRALSGTRLFQLGLTASRAVQNMLSGWLAWLLLTPPVLLIHVLAAWAYRVSEGVPPEEHPLARLARGQPLAIEWIVIVLSGVVIAPILEELLFRRVLQGWAAKQPWGSAITLAVAFALTLGRSLEKITKDGASLGGAVRILEPALFVLILTPVCFLGERVFRPWLPRPYTIRAICSTALFFAISHDWPTPVPLFVLGLGLGYLAYRTQSLVAPIVMHALFNGVACLLMLLTYAAPVNGNETTCAGRRPSAVSTSRIVPGSWLPLRAYPSAICPSLGETTDDVMRPTSLSAWKSLAPTGTEAGSTNFKPTSDRLTWP